ncbi:FAD/NAD(P)-binding protein [Streptomyces benahoarensis]|uniref:FAD-dependent urate hydroxylase HpyO/Asp monooxygenase CreE-like FAD/NAD(P)-binding domain-containing protein n=1 Tax=Streptomyces benahoarensis TaxID=2595054 RepID=A0A553ZQB2_9ACTN|nr:FAD/NAD(P)-binding protein [Streptomyces benahoarensis]TSB32348.1 hypothetical protein FNJ62_02305 [Streptomyces benahoarensis]TSB43446.1 hypothetical protein FNZ23_04480 [Streptomyces benahoarensis]
MRLAVIGGGAAAVSLLDSMLRHAGNDAAFDITVHEGARQLATGRAYRPDLDCALVNREAGFMSVRSAERDHFLRWLHRQPRYAATPLGTLPPDAYVPRRVYGEYLVDHWEACLQGARRRGWTVTVVPEFATVAKASAGEVMIRGAASLTHADRVVLCPGSGPPADPYGLAGAPGFHPDPYPLTAVLPRIAEDAHVMVLGTGLSGVDVALGLLHRGHRGRITMTSRHGLLPGVRARHRPFTLTHLTPEAIARHLERSGSLGLRDTFALLGAELAAAGTDLADETAPRPAHDRLRSELARLDGNPYQTIATTALRDVRESVWTAWGDHEKRVFLRRFHPLAKPLYNPMPPPTARRLLAAMDSGQLTVRAGTAGVRARAGGGFEVVHEGRAGRADVVVDATRTGLATTGPRSAPLLRSLADAGLVVGNPHGGLLIDPATNALRPDRGQVPGRLYALGDLTSGDLFYAGSMYMINVRAELIAHELVAAAT